MNGKGCKVSISFCPSWIVLSKISNTSFLLSEINFSQAREHSSSLKNVFVCLFPDRNFPSEHVERRLNRLCASLLLQESLRRKRNSLTNANNHKFSFPSHVQSDDYTATLFLPHLHEKSKQTVDDCMRRVCVKVENNVLKLFSKFKLPKALRESIIGKLRQSHLIEWKREKVF